MGWMDALSLGLRKRLPIILQTEGAECGLACLGMVMGYHGVLTDLATLRQRHAISMKGITLATLSELAVKEKLGFRAVRLELNELAGLKVPAILHWELNHFVVLKEVRGSRVIIHDPAFGERKLTLDEVSRRFTGVALELWPAPDFEPRKEKTRISVGQLVGQVAGFWPSLTQVLLLTLALEVFALVQPLFMQWIIDQVVVSKDGNLLTTLAIGFLIMLFVQQGIGLLRTWVLLVINTSIRIQWRANIFTHLVRLPVSYFQKRHLGDIVSRTGSIDQIQQVLTSTFVEALFDGALVIITLLMMFTYSPTLALIAIVAVAIYLVVRIVWFGPFYAATEEFIVRSANLSSHFLETIRGVRAIKLFGRQIERQSAWQTLLVNETNAGLTIQKLQIFYGLIRTILSGGFNILLLYLGTQQILAGTLSVGMLLAFLAYRSQFDSRLTELISKGFDLKMLQLYAERLADVVLTEPEVEVQRTLTEVNTGLSPEIIVDNVRFRYADQEPWVLNGTSLTIAAGESVAIVGGSGCGKTTLVNLLSRFYDVNQGRVLLDGIDLRDLATPTLRQNVGVVLQEPFLFRGTIFDNLIYGRPQSSLEETVTAARAAQAHDFILRKPLGYDTWVGERGAGLSGGERQRVSIARALLYDPKILILDEATSSIDTESEQAIQDALRVLVRGLL